MEAGGLSDFFVQCLEDLYSLEKKFTKCAAALSIAAYTEELQHALMEQAREAETHIGRLELVFSQLEKKVTEGRCRMIDTLSDKAAEIVKTIPTGTAVRDAAIIYAVQLIVHYKIASYGSLMSLLNELEDDQARLLLERCLAEEKNADAYLTQIAGNIINPAAKKESSL